MQLLLVLAKNTCNLSRNRFKYVILPFFIVCCQEQDYGRWLAELSA